LKWSSGWIDRGGWRPQIFGDTYFYANGVSLVWQYTEDIELSLDVEKRQVQYRSSTRLGQTDWDVEKLRYNQFVKMLSLRGGWEIAPLEKDLYILKTPYRWVDLLMTKSAVAIEKTTDAVLAALSDVDTAESTGTSREQLSRLRMAVEEYLRPVKDRALNAVDVLLKEPNVREAVRLLNEIESKIQDTFGSDLSSLDVQTYVSRFQDLLPKDMSEFLRTFVIESKLPQEGQVAEEKIIEMDEDQLLKEYGEIPSDSSGLSGYGLKLPNLPNFENIQSNFNIQYIPEEPAKKTVIDADEFRKFKDSGKPWLQSSPQVGPESDRREDRSSGNAVEDVVESALYENREKIRAQREVVDNGVPKTVQELRAAANTASRQSLFGNRS
jgi:Protein of unknown function (DUF1499)